MLLKVSTKEKGMNPYWNFSGALWQECFERIHNDLFLTPQPQKKYQIFEKKEGELLSDLDLILQDRVLDFLADHFPFAYVVSEEGNTSWPPEHPLFWLVDPLDGSHNNLLGVPLFGIMIAYIMYGRVEFSAFYLPYEPVGEKGGFYFAARGEGAWRMGKGLERLQVSKATDLSKAMLLLEGKSKSLIASEKVRKLASSAVRFRNGLSASWASVVLASSNLRLVSADLLLALDNKPWDNLPGCLLVEEAGGRVTDLSGNPYSLENCSTLLYSNGILHDVALECMEKGATR